jgi:hypothetical protein
MLAFDAKPVAIARMTLAMQTLCVPPLLLLLPFCAGPLWRQAYEQ